MYPEDTPFLFLFFIEITEEAQAIQCSASTSKEMVPLPTHCFSSKEEYSSVKMLLDMIFCGVPKSENGCYGNWGETSAITEDD